MRINDDREVCSYHNKDSVSDEETPWSFRPPAEHWRQPTRPSLVGLRPIDPVEAPVELQLEVIAEPGLNFVHEPQIAVVYHGRPVAAEGDSRIARERREASVAQRSRRARELRPDGGEEFLLDNTTDLEPDSPVAPVDAPAAAADASQMPPHLLGTMNSAILREYLAMRGDEDVYSIAKAATSELNTRKELANERAALARRAQVIEDGLQAGREDMSRSMAAVATADNSAPVIVQTAWQAVAATQAAAAEDARQRAAAAEDTEYAETARKQNLTSQEKERALSAARRVKLVSASVVAEDREEELKRMERRAQTAKFSAWNEAEDLKNLRAKLAAEKAHREEKAAAEKALEDRRRTQEENAKARAETAFRVKESLERQKQMRAEKEEAERQFEQSLAEEVLPYLMWFFLPCGVYKEDFNDGGSRSPIVRLHRVSEFCFPDLTHCRNDFGFPCSSSDPPNHIVSRVFFISKRCRVISRGHRRSDRGLSRGTSRY